ncbi:Uncharacterised protein [Klebsiella pneumoniae]|nr:Uncharacterised protein [Klebsiella pneumoniae]
MFQRTDTAFGAIVIQGIPAAVLRERLGGTDARRAGAEHFFHRVVLGHHHIVLFQGLRQRQAKDVFDLAIQQPGAVQLAQNAQHAAGAMHIFHMVFLRARRHLTQLRHFAGELIDIAHGEVDFSFLRRRQQVQNGIGGAAHGDIQRHSVLKGRLAGDIARQRGSVILLVIAFGQLHDTFPGV